MCLRSFSRLNNALLDFAKAKDIIDVMLTVARSHIMGFATIKSPWVFKAYNCPHHRLMVARIRRCRGINEG